MSLQSTYDAVINKKSLIVAGRGRLKNYTVVPAVAIEPVSSVAV
jgi:hypothetical protein